MEGSKIFSGYVFSLKNCDNNLPYPLHDKYKAIRDSIEDLLSTETVLSLAEKYPAYKDAVLFKSGN
jgi:Rrf2 family transcriptional regulator, iron-sulfur cluster assembly transcription factor